MYFKMWFYGKVELSAIVILFKKHLLLSILKTVLLLHFIFIFCGNHDKLFAQKKVQKNSLY